MKYDFTTILDRGGHDAVAVDAVTDRSNPNAPTPPKPGFDVIPMWIADMSFPLCPAVQKAVADRLQVPHCGYFAPRKEYFDSIIRWQTQRNGAQGLAREHISYENGVLGGLMSAMNVLCSRGDKVLVHSPTYIGFTNTLTNAGLHIIHSPLYKDQDSVWRMDFEDMEKKIVEHSIHTAIFCSPHNPTGRVWDRWEVEKYMDICQKHDVYVVSDEIWSDILRPELSHVPTQSVSPYARERTIALYAPSKTFSLAGLVGAYHIAYNKRLQDRMIKESSLSHYNNINLLSMYALIGAYSAEGEAWSQELRQVIAQNVDHACAYIQDRFPGVEVIKPQGTYMLYLDCTKWCEERGKTIDDVKQAGWDVGIGWQDGRAFHGPCHLRVNLALPLSRLQEALERMDQYVFNGK